MGDRQRARRIPDAEWEVWHQKLVRLYVEEDVSRKDITQIMAHEHNFVITDTQLKHRFQKWDVKKNINDEDMTTMLALTRKRQTLGKDIRFQYKGHDVEQERLERAYKRQRRELASPTFIQPYIKVYTTPYQSPQPASQVFVRGYSASQDLERHFNPSTSDTNSQNMQASSLMEWTKHSLDPGQYSYTHNTREPGFVEVTQTLQDVFMTAATVGSVDSLSGPGAVEGGFNPNAYEPLNTEATSILDQNQASSDMGIGQPSRSGSAFSAGAWKSLVNWSSSPASSVLAVDERSSERLPLPRDTVRSPTIDIMPLLRGVESEGDSLSTELHVQVADDQPITCAGFDPSNALLPLLLMKAHLEQDFGSDPYRRGCSHGSNLPKLLDTVHSERLRIELDNVICWLSETVFKDIRQHQARRQTGKFASPFKESREPSAHRRRSGDTIETNDEVQSIGRSYAWSKSHRGVLRVTLGNVLDNKQHANTPEALTVSFMPKDRRRATGLHVALFNVMREIRGPRISPRLRTFNVVPDDSEIVKCVRRNDIDRLQTLLDKGEASPTDVDSRGFSLLSYAMYRGNCDVLRLLLEGGADIQTCEGGSALNMVWAIWDKTTNAHLGAFCPDLPHSIIRSVDQCMSMSDAALGYGCDMDNSIAYKHNPRLSNPLFKIIDHWSFGASQAMMDAIRYLCNIGYDMEERNSKGETLYLFGATRLCPSVITSLKFLIEIGADLSAVDPYNCGALHLALMAPDGWGAWGSSCTDACNHINYDHAYLASVLFRTESEDYAEDYCNDGLTPAPSPIDDIQSDHLAYDDGVQEGLCRACGTEYLPTTDSTRSGSPISRGRSGQYIDLDETDADDEDEEIEVEEDDEGASGEDDSGEEEDETDEDNDAEDLEIPEGYVLCYDSEEGSEMIRKPLPILKTRLRFKLLTLLRAGCDPNLVDNHGNSPSDDARYHGLWPEWAWALLNAGYVFDEDGNRWVKRLEEEVSINY